MSGLERISHPIIIEPATPDLVVKDNALLRATYEMDLIEHRILILAIAISRETGGNITSDTVISINSSEYSKVFNVTRQAAYSALKKAGTTLFKKDFTYSKITEKGNVEVVKSRWLSSYSYVTNEARITIQFAAPVIPLISNLKKEFASYRMHQISGLTTFPATRLYEFLLSWRVKKATPITSIENLRGLIGIPEGMYLRVGHFKARVLDPAVHQINETTDILVSYEQIKKGREIVGFKFNFMFKPNSSVLGEAGDDSELSGSLLECGIAVEALTDKQLTMTAKQASYFAALLAKDSMFARAYAPTGMSENDFKLWIEERLKDAGKVREWAFLLEKVGFAFKVK